MNLTYFNNELFKIWLKKCWYRWLMVLRNWLMLVDAGWYWLILVVGVVAFKDTHFLYITYISNFKSPYKLHLQINCLPFFIRFSFMFIWDIFEFQVCLKFFSLFMLFNISIFILYLIKKFFSLCTLLNNITLLSWLKA